MVIKTRNNTNARSWNNNMQKLTLPNLAVIFCLSVKICITTAVDDKHKAINSQDQVDDGFVEAENRPASKKRAEPKKLRRNWQ